MDRNLYVDALMIDPYLAATIKAMLYDGEIDRAAAELAWIAVIQHGDAR